MQDVIKQIEDILASIGRKCPSCGKTGHKHHKLCNCHQCWPGRKFEEIK